ncbi:MAG: tetratricopeptide repeat protein [Acidobacteriota bacterium]
MKKLALPLIVLLCAAVAIAVTARDPAPAWSTVSEEAMAAFEAGLQAQMKLYTAESNEHFRRAVEIDPDFVGAKLAWWWNVRGSETAKKLKQEIEAVDLTTLTPREVVLVRYRLAEDQKDQETADRVLAEYLERYPDDPFVFKIECQKRWDQQRFLEAEECYRRLIADDPNWVMAQNLLGYLAMSRGDFRAAEEQFTIYRYLAPDQANPHDSMGELLALTGRFDEAAENFRRAIEVRQDFCPAWGHLVESYLLAGSHDEARRAIEAGLDSEYCRQFYRDINPQCFVDLDERFALADWKAVWQLADDPACPDLPRFSPVPFFRAALALDRREDAKELREMIAGYKSDPGEPSDLIPFLEAIELDFDGDPAAAEPLLAAIDDRLHYWSLQSGTFKVAVKIQHAKVLRQLGREDEANARLAEARRVNPVLTERWNGVFGGQPQDTARAR